MQLQSGAVCSLAGVGSLAKYGKRTLLHLFAVQVFGVLDIVVVCEALEVLVVSAAFVVLEVLKFWRCWTSSRCLRLVG